MRLLTAELTKKNFLKLSYRQVEIGINGLDDAATVGNKKTYDKEAHRDLIYAFNRLCPHLLFQTELIDKSVAIPADIEDKKYFDDFLFDDDERFEGVTVTKVQTFGKNEIEGIKIFGEKTNSNGDVCPLRTGVIYFNQNDGTEYALRTIVQSQYETLEFECEEYDKGKNSNTITNQLQMFDK